jgi:hypothetical protein
MTIPLRNQIIIGTVSLVCLILIGVSFILLRQIGPSPASLLPADRTVMLVSNLSPESQRQMQSIIPGLADAPLQEQGTTVAALITTGTTTRWVIFDANGTPQSDTSLMVEGERPLSSDSVYRQLQQTYTTHAPWLFVRFPETPLQIDGLRTPSTPVAVTVGTGSVQIAWPTTLQSAFTGPVPPLDDDTVLRVSAARLGAFVMGISTLLSEQQTIAAHALLQSWISRTVGSEVSATYDILPSIDGAGTLMLQKTKTGSLALSLRALPHTKQEESMTRLEQGMLSTATGTERIQRTFDETFTFDTVQLAEGAEAEEMEIGAWTVHLSPGRAAMIGRSGREWAFGTDRLLFTSLIRAMQSSAAQHIAEGVIDPKAAEALLEGWKIQVNLPWELLPGTSKHVLWTLDRKGGLAILTIERL